MLYYDDAHTHNYLTTYPLELVHLVIIGIVMMVVMMVFAAAAVARADDDVAAIARPKFRECMTIYRCHNNGTDDVCDKIPL